MDRLTAMQVYRTVVDSGSFAQAAKLLQISAASASRHVSDLEQYLGTTLLRRSSRALLMTDIGRSYFEQCCEILDRIDEVENLACQAKAGVQGRLRVSMPNAFGRRYVAPLLPQFMERYPEIELDVWCSDQFVDFSATGFDVAIRITRDPDEQLIARELAPVRCVAAASPHYLEQRGVPAAPDELRAHDCITYAYAPYGNNWQFFKGDMEIPVVVRSVFRSNSGEVIRLACIDGQGISIFPTFMIDDDLKSGRLTELFSDYRFSDYKVYAVYPVDGRNSARTAVFVDFLKEAFAAAPPP